MKQYTYFNTFDVRTPTHELNFKETSCKTPSKSLLHYPESKTTDSRTSHHRVLTSLINLFKNISPIRIVSERYGLDSLQGCRAFGVLLRVAIRWCGRTFQSKFQSLPGLQETYASELVRKLVCLILSLFVENLTTPLWGTYV